jgi:hypothetical protein
MCCVTFLHEGSPSCDGLQCRYPLWSMKWYRYGSSTFALFFFTVSLSLSRRYPGRGNFLLSAWTGCGIFLDCFSESCVSGVLCGVSSIWQLVPFKSVPCFFMAVKAGPGHLNGTQLGNRSGTLLVRSIYLSVCTEYPVSSPTCFSSAVYVIISLFFVGKNDWSILLNDN